ncbi:hypothetical protein BG006_011196 [Podila minutissima]|uniref:DUF202 domain-containing protein n=1 Tax=Podila minutissima TaxID=64525 RepID=A0A9P5SC70_9FUNG|nr:hypothetical protein BG006_011196 [Podila minutissima]
MDTSPCLHPFDQTQATSAPTSPSAPNTRKPSISFNLHHNNPVDNHASKSSDSIGTVPLDEVKALPTQLVKSPSVASSSSGPPSSQVLRNRMEGKANQIAQSSDLSSNPGTAGTDNGDEQQRPPMIRRNTGPGGRYIDVPEQVPKWTTRLSAGLRKLYTRYSPSLTLENKGSIARDHLAVTQLFRLQQPGSNPHELIKVSELGRPLGGSFISLGILFLWLGTSRYFHNQTVLSYGQFPASRGSVILATVTVLAVLLACFIIVILQGRT